MNDFIKENNVLVLLLIVTLLSILVSGFGEIVRDYGSFFTLFFIWIAVNEIKSFIAIKSHDLTGVIRGSESEINPL